MKHKVLPYAKYLLLAIYFAIATFLWNRRDFLPIPELLGSFTRDCLFFSILLTGLVCLWTAIRRPPLITQKVNRALRQAGMLFNEYKDAMAERKGLGEGYLLVDGQDIEEVKVAPIQDMVVVERAIQKAMNRPTGGAETESAAPCP